MKITEICASRSCRMNTGNYEGTELFISMKAEVDELDDVAKEALLLNALCEKAMHAQLMRSYKVRKKKVTPEEVARQHGLSILS